MTIHIVKSGDTIDSIAETYGISVVRLMQDNELEPEKSLIPGQTIVITYPELTHIVKDGDTLTSISELYQTSLRQLLRNNPFLSDRQFIYPGEELIIRYTNNKGKLFINGFANSFINQKVLRKTLPFLTYLSIFGNRITADGEIVQVDDSELIAVAKEYGVAPIMFLSTLTAQGKGSQEAAYNILYNEDLVNRFINNTLTILEEKKYYGVNITFQFVNADNIQIYNDFITKLVNILHNAGFYVFITFSPKSISNYKEITLERIDYSYIGQLVDGIQFMSFNFGYSSSPPAPVLSVTSIQHFTQYAVTIVPPENLALGISVIGYDWTLPYVTGITKGNSLSINSAINLAGDVGATIEFDEQSQTPFYNYTEATIPIKHIVWFIDSRSVNGIADLVPEYSIGCLNVWNIMYYYQQLWLIINSQYEIEIIPL